MLPLWWEHSFEGSDPPKIGSETDSEGQRREKTQKIGSGAVSGHTFSAPGPFLVDFGAPAGSKNEPKSANLTKVVSTFGVIFLKLLCEPVWRRSGTVLGGSGDAPGTLPEGFWRHSERFFSRKYAAKTTAKIV